MDWICIEYVSVVGMVITMYVSLTPPVALSVNTAASFTTIVGYDVLLLLFDDRLTLRDKSKSCWQW